MPTKDFIQRFSGGADGAFVTKATSAAGGDAFDFITKNGGTDILTAGDACFTHRAATALEGAMGARWDLTGLTGNTYCGWFMPTGYGRRIQARYPIVVTGTVQGAAQIISRIDGPSSSSQMKINTANKLTISTTAAGDIVASTSANALAPGSYWVEQDFITGTTTANGTVGYKVFNNSLPDGSGVDTAVAGVSYTSSAQNTGTEADVGSATSRIRFQAPLANSGLGTWAADLYRGRVTDDLVSGMGPYVSTLPPTVTATAAAGYTITAATTNGKSPFAYSISQVTGTPGQAATALATPGTWRVPIPTGVSDVWKVTSTDANGTPTTYNVTVDPLGGDPAVLMMVYDGSTLLPA